MAYEIRGGSRRYYTRSFRANGKVRREYIGGGVKGELAAKADAERRAARQAQAEALRAEGQRHAAAVGPLDELARLTDLLMRATLIELGYHQHARGEWRRRRNVHTSIDEGLPGRVAGDHSEGKRG
jgi:hypothetical protein